MGRGKQKHYFKYFENVLGAQVTYRCASNFDKSDCFCLECDFSLCSLDRLPCTRCADGLDLFGGLGILSSITGLLSSGECTCVLRMTGKGAAIMSQTAFMLLLDWFY